MARATAVAKKPARKPAAKVTAKPVEKDAPPRGSVWVVDGGKEFHRNITCPRLFVPDKETVKMTQAAEDGFEPCPECYPEKKADVVKVEAPSKPKAPVHVPCEVSASWQDWMDAIKLAAFTGRHVLPVLAAAYITTDELGGVVMRASDLEVFTETKLPTAYMDGSGPLLVNARMLQDALKGIKGSLSASQGCCERVSVIRDKLGGTVVTGFGRALKLLEAAIPAEDYPDWPKGPGPLAAQFGSGVFVDAVGFALTAASRDDTLPMLTGVKMHSINGVLEMAGTDRYRLAVTEAAATQLAEFDALLPRTAWPVLKTLTGRVQMHLPPDGRWDALFTSGKVSTSVRLMDATFPPYTSLIPTDIAGSWVIDRVQLIGDIMAASAITDRNAPVQATFDVGKYQVQGCEFHEAVGGIEGFATAFNPQFLLDGLRAFHGDEVTLLGTSPSKPIMLRGQRFNHEATYLIMPVRLPE